jgi:hypothetical protein
VKGGIGKNLLVDKILHLIFDGQTVPLLTDNALGQFNSLIKGRAVALVDESAADNTSRTLLADLATLARNTVVVAITPDLPLCVMTRPTPVQRRAFELLDLAP